MDFAITTRTVDAPHDTRWRASSHGEFVAQPGTLDLSKFISGTHYNIGGRTDNVIPSGVAVMRDAASGLFVPFVAGDANVLAGYINDNGGVAVKRADGTNSTKAAFARLLHGFIETRYLPVAAQRGIVAAAKTNVQISYI